MNKLRKRETYVVKLLDSNNRTRNVIVHPEIDTTNMNYVYNYYIAGLLATEEKAKKGEIVVRISKKGYS